MRRLSVPWPLLAGLALLLAVGWGQGLRAARQAQELRQPRRAFSVGLDASRVVEIPAGERAVAIDLGPEAPPRVALIQALPQRKLLRWMESPVARPAGSVLVIPLEGLGSGEYWLCGVAADAVAGPAEMDRPEEDLDVLSRIRIAGTGSR